MLFYRVVKVRFGTFSRCPVVSFALGLSEDCNRDTLNALLCVVSLLWQACDLTLAFNLLPFFEQN
jgi:hypothetical protein